MSFKSFCFRKLEGGQSPSLANNKRVMEFNEGPMVDEGYENPTISGLRGSIWWKTQISEIEKSINTP